MNNNGSDKNNKEGENFLSYDNDTSKESAVGGYQSRSDSLPDSSTENQSPVQFGSRRERRKQEENYSPVATPQYSNYHNPTPVAWQNNQQAPIDPYAPKPPKEYWGGIALLVAFLIFLGAQLIAALIMVFNITLNTVIFIGVTEGDTLDMTQALASSPIMLLVILILGQYLPWMGSMWWVTKYRSGVQRGKKFWAAFKDNFRLNNFAWTDILWGAGIAGAMLALQFFVLTILPKWIPALKAEIDSAGNTDMFAGLDGMWFYIIGFGFVGVIGPIVEELFFRGFLLRGFSNHFSYDNTGRNLDILEDELEDKDVGMKSIMVSYRGFAHEYRFIIAALLSSVLFGIAHWQGSWVTCAFTGLLGLAFAIATLKLNKLYPAMIAHVLYNSTLMVLLSMGVS